MAYSRRDFQKAAAMVRSKVKVTLGGKDHFFDNRDKYVIALFLRDMFQAEDPLLNGLEFLTACGFKG